MSKIIEKDRDWSFEKGCFIVERINWCKFIGECKE